MTKQNKYPWARACASLLLLIQLLAPTAAHAQRPGAAAARGQGARASAAWPRVTSQSKPWTRWWWQGSAVSRRDLSREMEKYARAGLGGLELTPIYGVRGQESGFIEYLSPRWAEMFEHTLREAGRLGLGLDMATGTGWPFGGPWVGDEDACKNFASKTYELRGGERLSEPVRFVQKPFVRAVGRRPDIKDLLQPVASNPNLQELALDQVRFERPLPLQALVAFSERGERVELTSRVSADGRLDWAAPPGRWKLYAIFQGWHGKLVERAAPGGEGNVLDHFSARALRNYLAKFDRAFAGRRLGPLRAFFNDSYEVDDGEGQSNWTPEFFAEFLRRRGYDLREQLPALVGDGPEDRQARVLYDFRETVSDLLLDEFTKTWRGWAASKGALVRNQSHGSPANILDLYAASDIPETEGTDIVRMKFASSAANVTGKTLASAETVTWLDEHFVSSLGDVKRAVDLNFLGGINHVVYHGTAFSPEDEPWPGRLFYAAVHLEPSNPQWDDFPALNAYIARVQSFLQLGHARNDVLLYYPVHDMWMERGKETLVHVGGGHDVGITQGDAQGLLDAGYAFDLVSDRQLAQVTQERGGLRAGGLPYRTIVLPESRYVPLETFRKLLELARGGATIVVRKSLPADVPGMGNLEARRAEFKRLAAQLEFADAGEPGVRAARVGAGRFLLGEDLRRLLAHAGVGRESMVERGLHFTCRRHAGGDIYFILNRGDRAVNDWVPLQTRSRSAALFDPATGESGAAAVRPGRDGSREVYLQLHPGASVIVKTSDGPTRGPSFGYYDPTEAAQPVPSPWTVRFVKGGPELPPQRGVQMPMPWTKFGDAYRNFSGTAVYAATQFEWPEGGEPGGDWQLNLWRVADSARVRLNGRDLGTLVAGPFLFRVPGSLLRERNTLEIFVTNVALNRAIDMERRGVKYKRFYNINFPARRPENRGPDGLFDATKLAPRDAGLIDSVTLVPIKPLRP